MATANNQTAAPLADAIAALRKLTDKQQATFCAMLLDDPGAVMPGLSDDLQDMLFDLGRSDAGQAAYASCAAIRDDEGVRDVWADEADFRYDMARADREWAA